MNLKPKKLFLTLTCIGLSIYGIMAQNIEKGWKLVEDNQRKEAIVAFEDAVKKGEDKERALASLIVLKSFESGSADAQEKVLELIKIAKDPNPYLYAFWNYELGMVEESLNKTQIKIAELVLEDNRFSSTLKAMANYALATHYELQQEDKDANKHFEALGAIKEWQLTGIFDNISASGFDKTFDPVSMPQANAEFTNKNDAKVGWLKLPSTRTDRFVDFTYFLETGNSICYAQSFINSPEDREVTLGASASGSLKIWINDAQIASIAEERRTDLDVYSYKVQLKKGFNRILVQIGASEISSSSFLVRLLNSNGTPFNDLSYSAFYQAYPKVNTGTIAQPIKIDAQDYFEKLHTQSPKDLLYTILLAHIYNRNENKEEAKALLVAAIKNTPKCTLVRMSLLETYVRLNDDTEHSIEKQKLMDIDPDSKIGLEMLINRERENDKQEEVEKLINKMHDLYGDSPTYFNYLMALKIAQSKYNELVEVVNTAYSKYPDNLSFVRTKAVIERELNRNNKLAINIIKRYYEHHADDEALGALANAYNDNNERNKSIDLYLEMLERKPYLIGYMSHLSDEFYGIRNYSEALKWTNKAIAQAPSVGYYWKKHGDILMEQGDEASAKKSYQKSLYYDPIDYDIRKKIRTIDKKKDIYSYFKDVDVYSIIKNAPNASEYPDDNSIILHYENQSIVYPEGGFEQRTILAAKVLTTAGIEDWKEYSIGYNGYTQNRVIEKAEIVKANGNKIEAETSGGYIVFKGIEVGDAVYMAYRIEDYSTGKLSKHFWDRFQFNYGYPALNTVFNLLVPKDKKFEYKVENAKIEPTIKDADEFSLYTWSKAKSAGIKNEVLMPKYSDITEALFISSIPSWDYLSEWYADLALQKTQSDPVVKATVAEILKGKEKASEREKAEAIYNYIIKNIKYSSVPFRQGRFIPQKAYKTLSNKLGDCKDVSTLFVSMAKEAGLKAKLVLINTRDNGDRQMVLPSRDFNHCIATVNADNKDYYLELTSDYMPFGTATYALKNANSLIISPADENTQETMKPLVFSNAPVNSITRQTHISFDNNDMKISRVNNRNGLYAYSYREDYVALSQEDRDKSVLNGISSDFKTTVKLSKFTCTDLDANTDLLVSQTDFSVKNYLNSVGSMKIMALPWTDAINLGNMISQEHREYPILAYREWFDDLTEETLTIEIPQGKTLTEVPANQSFKFKNMSYDLSFSFKDNVLTAKRTQRFNEDILPASDYANFQEFMNKVLEADAIQIGFK